MKLEKNLKTKEVNELFEVISNLKSANEVKKFMRDIATPSEIKAFAERWQVAKLVDKEIPYREISKKTGASTTTVTRVAQWLHHGLDGYRLMLDRLKL